MPTPNPVPQTPPPLTDRERLNLTKEEMIAYRRAQSVAAFYRDLAAAVRSHGEIRAHLLATIPACEAGVARIERGYAEAFEKLTDPKLDPMERKILGDRFSPDYLAENYGTRLAGYRENLAMHRASLARFEAATLPAALAAFRDYARQLAIPESEWPDELTA